MQIEFKKRKDGFLLTPMFMVTFPQVFNPNDDGKYGLGMVFDIDTDFTNLEELIEETIKLKWNKKTPRNLMLPILVGDDSDRAEYEGKMYINGKCGKYRPGVVGPDKMPIEDEEDFYPGCFARATVNCYAWEFKGKAGVSVAVRNLQKMEEGTPLVGRVRPDDDFNAIENDESEDL